MTFNVLDKIAELHEQLAAEYRRLAREEVKPQKGERRVAQPKKVPRDNILRDVREKLSG